MPDEDLPNPPRRGWRESLGLSWITGRSNTESPKSEESLVQVPSAKLGEEHEVDVAVTSSSSSPSTPNITLQDRWERIKAIYTDDGVHMERDATIKMTRMAFVAGTLIGGLSGSATARQRYDLYSTGRTYLSPRDSLRRKWDYGIVMFVKHGFRTGIRSAALVGSVVLLTTHMTVLRDRFSAWYFPAISGANALFIHRVGSVLAFPLGFVGSLKALGLGISSGLSLSAVAVLYAMSMDKSVNEAYNIFKQSYENDLKTAKRQEHELQAFMKEHNIPWRRNAMKQMRLEEERLLLEEPTE